MEQVIELFFEELKKKFIKKETKAKSSEEEVMLIQREAEDKYRRENWLPLVSKKAGGMPFSTHPYKFSHSSAEKSAAGKTTPVIASCEFQEDGFLRSGNVMASMDALANAADIPYYKFLTLILSDGKTVIEHIENDTDVAKSLLDIKTKSYEELKTGFMKIKDSGEKPITNSKVKQVFFPVGDNYHLLSILTPSGIMYKLRDIIQDIRFGENTSKGREAKTKNIFSEPGFEEIPDLSIIGYGGGNPQNVSVLNSQYKGRSYLLSSKPPTLDKRKVRLPGRDFFSDCIWPGLFAESFHSLHSLLKAEPNNIHIREGRDAIFMFIYDRIVDKVWSIRAHSNGWSDDEKFNNLPQYQKIILDDAFKDNRDETSEDIDKFNEQIARWLVKTAYQKVLGKKALMFDDSVFSHVESLCRKQKEALI